MTWRRAVAGLRWYLREVSGEADYDRYLARARPDVPVMSRREFERHKMKARDAHPGARCC
ncbi:MAG: YbdD/YjiX family protein [Frankiaceae bacterium]